MIAFSKGTASEAALVAMLASRTEAVKKLQSDSPGLKDHEAVGKLIAYGSDQVVVWPSKQCHVTCPCTLVL